MNAVIALCHFCEQHGPRIMLCTQAFHGVFDAQSFYGATLPSKSAKRDSSDLEDSGISIPKICDACRSLDPTTPGLVSHDEKSNIYFLSYQKPLEKETFAALRQACLGSLSFEGPKGFEGPMIFGENPDVYVLSYQFFLDDFKARGKRRRYSLIAVMKDKYHLVSSWIFLVTTFRRIVHSLKDKASKVFTKEEGENSLNGSSRFSHRNSCERRVLHKDEIARSLVTLINYDKIFMDLHQEFIFVLQTGSTRWRERGEEWPPTLDSSRSPSLSPPPPVVSSNLEDSMESYETLDLSTFTSPPKVLSPCGLLENRSLLSKESTNGATVRSLRQLYSLLGLETFLQLACHTLKGDLVIIRGSEKTTVVSILTILADLLPAKCCRAVPYSTIYLESYPYTCNLLGLNVGVEVPDQVANGPNCVILDIFPPLEDSLSPIPSTPTPSTTSSSSGESSSVRLDRLCKYKFLLNKKKSEFLDQYGVYPTLLHQLVNALQYHHFSDKLVDQYAVAAKKEWLTKAKTLYGMSKLGLMEGTTSSQRDDKLHQVLGILQAGRQDLDVLKFLFAGISDEERQQIRACNNM